MEKKRIAMLAATGSAAFIIGFAAVGLVAMVGDTITQVSGETTRIGQAVEPVKSESQAAITPEPAPGAEVVNEWPTPTEYEISDGTYYADDFKPPRKFRDIESFTFELYDYDKQLEDGSYGVPIPPRGTVKIGKTNFKFSRVSVGKNMIGFQTEERNGVSYRFTGKFNNFEYCETEEEQPDVVGRMIKLVNNKWAAEAEMSFFSGGCGC
jgi:hypothetical protein